MGRIILVRHGETLWNKDARYQGHTDVDLSEVGREQARKAAVRLQDEPIAAVYASDLSRAYETAEVIAAEHGLPVEKVAGLREIHFGTWEGMRLAEIKETHGELYAAWREEPQQTRPPGGETFSEVLERARLAIESIAARHPAETVVVVAHGGTIRSLLCHYQVGPFWECTQGNTAFSILEHGPAGVRVISNNDISHLGD